MDASANYAATPEGEPATPPRPMSSAAPALSSGIGGVVRPATSASRPPTGPVSARMRAPASGRTNRRSAAITSQPAQASSDASAITTPSARARQLQMRATGTFALNKSDTGRVSVQSMNSPELKKMETVSLLRDSVPGPKDWISEMHASQRPGEWSFADKLLELNEEKHMIVQQAIDKFNSDKGRRKLQRLVNFKFAGSVDILFQNADTDGDGELDFEEFSAILKRHRLEQFFPRKEQRDVFKAIDKDLSNKVTMDELVEYLMDDPQDEAGRPKVVKMPGNVTPNGSSRYSHASEADSYRGNPFAANAEAKSGKDMAFTTNAADRTAAQELKKRAEKSKDRIVKKIVDKRTKEKNEDGHMFTAQYLLNALKQCDKDMSGTLSKEEIEFCFGPKWLDLDVDQNDMDDFVEVADVDKDGAISYKEFINALQIHDLDPAYNPVMEARERGLKRLHDRVQQPFKFQKEYDAFYAKMMEAKAASEALDEQRRLQAEAEKHPPADGSNSKVLLPDTWSASRKLLPRLPAPGSDKNPGNDGRSLESGSELFADLERINGAIRASTGTRLSEGAQAIYHSHDNSRVGVGTAGINPRSGLFADSTERFGTTSKAYHAPLVYAPNQPVTRPTAKCNSTEDASFRASRRQARYDRAQGNLAESKMFREAEVLMDDMGNDQRERASAEAMYGYLRKAYFKDLKMHAREPLEDMARKPNWPLHTRMYETSKNTQLRDMTHKHETRDFGTLHTRDLWGSRLGQTSFELGGGALPDLHRTTMHGRY